MELELKKPAVDLTELAIGIIVLGVVVTIGVKILITQRDNRLTELSTFQTINESSDFTTASSDALAKTWGLSVDKVFNNTHGEVITSGNYSVSVNPVNGVMTISNSTTTFKSEWYVTYTNYNTSRADWSLPNNASIGIAEYGNWFKVIVIVGVAAVILGILMSFGRKGSSEISGSY